ncbi:hypothetical protein U14_01944 [Candidatus Moduliflexus flocculans]|uniref:Uncharacterized protein n=1 Tax=Candidatus Moduliflexus flocculans TaxID=1499966 RepID=A0A0S6VTG2_9BACT|nr:hypothetical protein U14_01944 [Candidatus Moduliflexus flocculans]
MIKTTDAQITAIKDAIESNKYMDNEKIWTFLIANIIDKSMRKNEYLKIIVNDDVVIENSLDLWFESMPIPPKQGVSGGSEGNTHLDLAVGDIKQREGTQTGIEFNRQNDWVCFIEAKLYSDCSSEVSYDPFRNQIARVIENLVTFQHDNNFPSQTYFTLLTPRIYKQKPFAKLYGYKYFEYHDRDNLKKEFRECRIPCRNTSGWKYPENIDAQVRKLKMNWITYEDILEKEYNLNNLNICQLNETEREFINTKFHEMLRTDYHPR